MTYEGLVKHTRRIGMLGYVEAILVWDQEVTMPKKTAWLKAEELSTVAALKHELLISDKTGALLDVKPENEEQEAMIREITWDYKRAKAVPSQLVERFAKVRSESLEVWKEAREKSDYALVIPYLKELLSLHQEYAQAINPKKEVYEVLLEGTESGIPLKEVRQFFDEIKNTIIPILRDKQIEKGITIGNIPEWKQRRFIHEMLTKIGYDFEEGRIDVTAHPFTAGFGRITTRFTQGWLQAVTSAIHEAGHAFYEMHLPREHIGTPLGETRSIAVHESQSIFWQRMIGESDVFWDHFFPKLREEFNLHIAKKELVSELTRVQPGCIRVDADPLTYPLHVILRFELEQELLNGELTVEDAPNRWNRKMQGYLGITPPSDKEGILQDIHWFIENMGYFPTYLLGAVMAAQLYAAAKRDIPDWDERIRRGDFSKVHEWLTENIHKHGRRYSTKELIKRATGKELSTEDYLTYLKETFGQE